MRVSPDQARFIAMASDDGDTWDLTDQDRNALKWAVDQIESLQDELDALKAASQAAIVPAPESAVSADKDEPEPGGIPFMITKEMRRQLGKLGYSPDDIRAMTPADAHAALQSPNTTGAEEVESVATPRVGGRKADGTNSHPQKAASSIPTPRRSKAKGRDEA